MRLPTYCKNILEHRAPLENKVSGLSTDHIVTSVTAGPGEQHTSKRLRRVFVSVALPSKKKNRKSFTEASKTTQKSSRTRRRRNVICPIGEPPLSWLKAHQDSSLHLIPLETILEFQMPPGGPAIASRQQTQKPADTAVSNTDPSARSTSSSKSNVTWLEIFIAILTDLT